MGKDKSEKKDRKEKKEKLTEVNGVSKKSKKDKKEKKEKRKSDVTELLEAGLDSETSPAPVETVIRTKAKAKVDEDGDEDMSDAEAPVAPATIVGAVVPFANPLADDKQTKKVLKSVKKAAKHKTLKRGVKEVVKALRKSEAEAITSVNSKNPAGVVIIAADISPMDVISHLPVLCEDHNIPYIYVTSRAELGAAGATKRPTSVVMVSKDRLPGKKGAGTDADEKKEYAEVYGGLVKLVLKASEGVKK
ncbi:L30e-like protein [Mytilinidion resinicola]|uniref:H/ACA ribonucleoprotein complex subunit 2 n=1 Tax=Mytilinidion resinicola TaxID=574789 RepID=A0A6A6YDD1_9PEZI|nr:L30e-like protein [Mytilinidion resinicola]KAF2806568.1 L30e-like protein [Mytilinidion resinicola]